MSEWKAVSISDEHPSQIASSCPWSWRIANVFMAIFFALAAYVQINDPDPAIWVTVYTIPCLLCFAVVLYFPVQEYFLWKGLTSSHLGACIIGALYLSTIVSTHVQNGSVNPLEHEEGRELSGLLFVILWLALCKLVNLKSVKMARNYMCIGAVSVSFMPFILWGYYIRTWDTSTLPGHCKNMLFS